MVVSFAQSACRHACFSCNGLCKASTTTTRDSETWRRPPRSAMQRPLARPPGGDPWHVKAARTLCSVEAIATSDKKLIDAIRTHLPESMASILNIIHFEEASPQRSCQRQRFTMLRQSCTN